MSALSKAFSTDSTITLEASVTTPEEPGVGAKREDEIVIYAKVNDFTGLKKASSKESHEQWEVKAPFGKTRIRKTTVGDLEPTYKQAIKRRDDFVGIMGGTELEIPSDQSAFEAFKAISDSGMIKDRYIFTPTKIAAGGSDGQNLLSDVDLKYEVDVYPDGHGGYHQWCKIDIEVNDLLDKIAAVQGPGKKVKLKFAISGLPFKPTEMILGSSEKLEDKEKIDLLYKEIFQLKKNARGDIRTSAGKKSADSLLGGGTTEVSETTQDSPVATETPVPVGDNPQNTELPPEPTQGGDATPPAEEVTETNTTEDGETTEVTDAEVVEPPSIDEVNKNYIQQNLEKFKGKAFEGTRTGNKLKFTDDEGGEYELQSSWGVRGINVPVTISFDENGEMKEDLKKNGEGTVEATKD
jgi:hypothetical protein